MAEVCANSEDPDQTPYSEASDLGLHRLPNTLLEISRLQWVNVSQNLGVNYIAPDKREYQKNGFLNS